MALEKSYEEDLLKQFSISVAAKKMSWIFLRFTIFEYKCI